MFLVLVSLCFMGSAKIFEESFTKTVSVFHAREIMVLNKNGDITINGWDKEEMKLEAVKRVRCPSDKEAEKIMKVIEIEISEAAETTKIETKIPENGKHYASVEYNIWVPKKSPLSLSTMNGDIVINEMAGRISGNTMNGDIEYGAKSLENSKGISLSTMNGDIVFSIPKDAKPSIKAGTVNGKMRSDFPVTGNDSPDGINLKTMNGDILIKGL